MISIKHVPLIRKRAVRAVLPLLTILLLGTNQSSAQDGMKDARMGSTAMTRDPFWPVGYTPENSPGIAISSTESARPKAGSSWNEAMKRVVINGVSSRSDNEYYAVINGEVKSVGDTVSVVMEGTVYTWIVEQIEPPDNRIG